MCYNHRLYLLLASLILAAGCSYGAQRGRYVASGGQDARLANDGGWISKIRGTPADKLTAPSQLLIAVLFIGPGFATTGSSHQTYLSTLDVESPNGDFTIEWNRSTETASIHTAEYDRTEGNIFVVRIDGGEIASQQINAIIDSVETEDILSAVKNALPDDAEVQALAARSNE